ncbi:hypothetical protein SMITH_278 [Smithella sp. ME-1]|nr:hypothetical protein SMITH_278 [Smithella sp. ME-1]
MKMGKSTLDRFPFTTVCISDSLPAVMSSGAKGKEVTFISLPGR